MSGLEGPRITRGKFIGLGLSAALLSSGISPFVAKAQTVNFNAASSAKLTDFPYNCRGDGSDEAEKIQKCFSQNMYVEVPEPPAGVGYGIGPRNLQGVLMHSGLEVDALGADSKFLRVGPWRRYQKCFTNLDHINGNTSIKLNSVYIEGSRYEEDVPTVDSECDTTAISFYTLSPDVKCTNVHLIGVQVHNWPGVSYRVVNGSGIYYTDVKSMNPSRGGVIFHSTSGDLHLLRVLSGNSGDDAIAFNAASGTEKQRHGGPITGITMDNCESYTRSKPQWGAALKLGGATEVLVTNSTFRHAKNSLVYICTFPDRRLYTDWPQFHPGDIAISDCKMLGGMVHSLQIKADQAKHISTRRNYMEKPAENCVNVQSLWGDARTFDVTITENTLVKPDSGKHITVQENLSGVDTKGNTLVYSDTTKPTISGVFPQPGSSIARPDPTIKATIKDDTILFKSNLKLYVNGNAIPRSDFGYSSWTEKLLWYHTPKLDPGEHTVKIIAADAAGNSATKSWSFTRG